MTISKQKRKCDVMSVAKTLHKIQGYLETPRYP